MPTVINNSRYLPISASALQFKNKFATKV